MTAPAASHTRRTSVVPLLLIALVAIGGAFARPGAPRVAGGPINTGDIAWMLTAAGWCC